MPTCKFTKSQTINTMAFNKWFGFIIVTILSVVVVSLAISSIQRDSKSDNDYKGSPLVYTPDGVYIGNVEYSTAFRGQWTKYVGIPFAQPPIGDLRFKKPQRLPRGNSSLFITANKYKKSCISLTKSVPHKYYGEDCLYLNIFVPGNQTDLSARDQQKKYSVMVWLHAGGFVAGSTFPEPTKLVITGDVIVVMVNYRMGVLGFLTTNDDSLPGNNGLWDQLMAIEWVKKNIKYFGGNESSITVFGSSAGAMSAHILSLSPLSTDLFHKSIFQSGSASSLLSNDYVKYTYMFADMVGCGDFDNHDELANCLRNISIEDIRKYDSVKHYNLTEAQLQTEFIWVPVIDGELIPKDPSELQRNHSYLESIGAFNRDYMIGILNNEGGIVQNNYLNPIPISKLRNTTFIDELLDALFLKRYGLTYNQTELLKETVYGFYLGGDTNSFSLTEQAVVDMSTDAMFLSYAIEAARSLSLCRRNTAEVCNPPASQSSVSSSKQICSKATTKVFFYYFDYCPLKISCEVNCMPHAFDMWYEFPVTRFDYTDERRVMSDLFIGILTSFAKQSSASHLTPHGWPEFEPENEYYLRLSPHPDVRQHLKPYRMRFWLNTLPTLVKKIKN